MSDAVYDRRTRLFHWLTALLVVLQWVGAHYIDAFPRGPLRTDARSVHITLGVLLIAVVAARLIWRNRGGVRLPPLGPAPMRALAHLTHWALYGLLAAVLVVGLANAWVRGDSLYDLVKIPSLAPGDTALRHQVEDIHELIANTLLIVAGVHAAAGIGHAAILRDGTLGRMLFEKSR